ncbi:hypothetical protein ElyMa_000696600 [Elysia marginata]|uniref:Uncharacterized protein n=1 Tax=Elysia marginata TaxID=1093978 RepID=A0AAV4GIY6_9GAST|nr:hypothetical protein ElyMa_000696600 [Elysia marginata]
MCIRKGHSFWPSRKPINYCKKLSHALAFRKRSHQVHMETSEPIRCGQTFCEWRLCMTMDFESLTVRKFFTLLADVTTHAMPHGAFHDGPLCGSNTRVTEAIDLVKNWSSPRRRRH